MIYRKNCLSHKNGGRNGKETGTMKRSKINSEIRHMEKMIQAHGFEIPPFCKWSAKEWAAKGAEYNEIRDNMLGWDITDYGLGRFD